MRDAIRAQTREHNAVSSGEPTVIDEGLVLATSGVCIPRKLSRAAKMIRAIVRR